MQIHRQMLQHILAIEMPTVVPPSITYTAVLVMTKVVLDDLIAYFSNADSIYLR